MPSTSIDVTPAGTGLFQVDLRDEQGQSTHEVAVPDEYAERFAGDEVSLQDVVAATMEWRLDREPREDIPNSFSIGELSGTGDFDQQVAASARDRASGVSPTTGQHTTTRDQADQDDKLLDQVREEQSRGEVSSQPKRV